MVAQSVKNPPALWETWVKSLGREDRLEVDMATHSSILAWRIPLDRGAWRATVHRGTKSWTWLKRLSRHTHNLEISVQILFNDQGNSPAAIQSQAWSLMMITNSNNFHNSKCPRQIYYSVLVDVYIAERVILYVYQSFSYWEPQWSLRNVKSH